MHSFYTFEPMPDFVLLLLFSCVFCFVILIDFSNWACFLSAVYTRSFFCACGHEFREKNFFSCYAFEVAIFLNLSVRPDTFRNYCLGLFCLEKFTSLMVFFLFCIKYSLNNRIKSLIAILSGSVS